MLQLLLVFYQFTLRSIAEQNSFPILGRSTIKSPGENVDFEMAMYKDEIAVIPAWDGEVATWPEYSRRVRLAYAQTPYNKRYTLGPRLVLKLRGRAWEVASSIDHDRLEGHSGTQYLLSFLKERLGRMPVADVGSHLDELFRCRRPYGMDMVSWGNMLRELYKKVQRSLARTLPGKRAMGTQTDAWVSQSAPTSPGGSVQRRASVSEPQREPTQAAEAATGAEEEGEESPFAPPEDDAAEDPEYNWSPRWWERSEWHERRWEDWDDGKWSKQAWKSDKEEFAEDAWTDFDTELPMVLPEEVLGWLLLRRSGLPPQARLSVQASAGNSLKFADVEKAMRLQDDELLSQEKNRQPHKGRSYWVEKDGAWGLVLQEEEEWDVSDDLIHWVEPSVMMAMMGSQTQEEVEPESEMTYFFDGNYDWVWHEDEWHAETPDGWIAFSDMKPWLDIEDAKHSDPSLGKELGDLFAVYDQKVRPFKEARDTMHFKGKSRGYYHAGKGKGQKGYKGIPFKGKKGSSNGQAMTVHGYPQKGKGTPIHQKPGYTGCFVCGDKGHDFRSCPKRGQSQSSSSALTQRPKHVGWVDTVDSEIYMVTSPPPTPTSPLSPTSPTSDGEVVHAPSMNDVQRMVLAAQPGEGPTGTSRLGFAVIDTGATETVGSLDAVEYVMNQRREIFGAEQVGVMPGRTKRFKFGNAEERSAESFIMLPQKIHGQDTSLGIYTLDVPGVPILLGIRTMKKLGALIDVSAPSLVFTKVFPGVHIPLTRGKNGHLLLNLCHDWTNGSTGNDPEGKGVQLQTGMQSHDVHVLEDYASESSRESDQEVAHAQTSAPCEQPLDDLQQLSIADRAHSSSASQLLTVSHGDVPRSLEPKDFHREISRDQQDDCGGSGSRGQEAEQDGPDQVRLGSCGVCQHSRPQVHRSSMLGKSFSRGLRKRQSLGQQRPCGVDRVQSVSPSPSVLPHVVSQGNLSQCWSNHRGCEEQVVEGPRTFTQRTDHSSLGDRSSRGLSRAPLGHPSCSESQDESQGHGEQGGREGDQEGLCDYRVSGRFSSLCQDATSAKEIGEERERSSPRDSGGERRREVMETSVKIPGTSNHDEPSLDDDALILEESTMDSPTCSYMLSESQKEKIAGSLHSAHEELVEILGTLQNDHCALLEVCCAPQSGLTEKIQQLGHVAYRIGLQNNMDLTTEVGYQRASDFGHSVKPNWMWFSVPCGPNSPIQNLNQRTEQQMHTLQKKRKKNKRIINNCIRLAREQIARGGHIGWEWPRENMGWSDPQLKGFFRYLLELGLFHVAMLDGCQVGVVAHDSGEPMKKPWKIVTSCSHMSKVMNLRCPGDHVHATCMGHSRAHHSAFYPPRMCSLLSQVMLEHVRTPLRTNVASAVFPVEDTPEEPMSEKELKQMKHVIHQLHVKAGHPTNSALKNMLRARGVDPRMVRLAGEH